MIDTTSYWNKTAVKTKYPPLEKSIDTDILIIGGGITGVTCAFCLAQKGFKPVLIEAGGLCDGTTGNTTGKVTIQHGIIYSVINKKHGKEFAKLYAEAQTMASGFVRKNVEKLSIDCQFANSDSYIFSYSKEEKEEIEKEYEIAKEIGIEAEFINKSDFPSGNMGMLRYKNQGVFHAVRYVEHLAREAVSMGAKIYCDTKAIKIKDDDIKTVYCENDIEIKAKHLVMATQYPIYDGPNLFYARLYPKRSYGIAVYPENDLPDGNYINVGKPSKSIRTHIENGKKVLIVVGEGHTTAREEPDMELHFENLLEYAKSIAGVEELLAKWSAQDYKTPDQIPYIGRISDNSNIYVAVGFGKWGLTNGTLSGNMIADLISEGSCRYEELFSRTRPDFTSSLGTVVSEVAGFAGELVKSKFKRVESLYDLNKGEGRVIEFEDKKAGIYRDFDDNVTVLNISCTHMTTILNYNSAEKTWDCPAHGGRFSLDGKLLEGPPKHNLKVLFKGKYSDLIDK